MKTFTALLLTLLITGALLITFGLSRFKREADRVATGFLTSSQPSPEVVTADMLVDLPAPVQRYLTYSGIVDKPLAQTVRLKQVGRIRADSASAWMPLVAEEYYRVSPPAFVWDATANVMGLPIMRVRDSYLSGAGQMLITVGGLLTIADMTGPEMDQGSLMRYLNEAMWFPSAFLDEAVTWQPVDDTSARVTLTDGDHSVSATLFFDEEGKVVNFLADRYRDNGDGTSTLMPWSTPITAYRTYASGLRLPSRGAGVWHLPSGEDLTYIELEILDVEENQPSLY
jgi:hypothetical protein